MFLKASHQYLLLILLVFGGPTYSHASSTGVVISISGAIGPASADYLSRGIDYSIEHNAHFIILNLDTPGGLDKAMRNIIKDILNSNIPVITYITPQGARAASAGTYILYASHIAAMAPATNLGAATPVQIGTPTLPTSPGKITPPDDDTLPSDDKSSPPHKKTATLQQKIVNDAEAYIKSLAKLRNRNVEWASRAVLYGESLSASEALDKNVIDLIAKDLNDLLMQLNGRTVNIGNNQIQLDTINADLKYFEPDWRNKFLSTITDPNVAYILMLLGIYGLILEFSNPGLAIPGIVGAICLMLALYSFQVLPISYAGLGLIILGIILMIGEAFSPSFGALGIGGIIAFIIGSIILMDTDLPAFQIALPVIISVSLTTAGFLIIIIGMAIRSRKQIKVSGLSTLEGKSAIVDSTSDGKAMVELEGERWQVRSAKPLSTGDNVRIISANGVILDVEKYDFKIQGDKT